MQISKDSFESKISKALGKEVKCLRAVLNTSIAVPTYYARCIDAKKPQAVEDPLDPDSAKKIYSKGPKKFYVKLTAPDFEPRVFSEQELRTVRKNEKFVLKVCF